MIDGIYELSYTGYNEQVQRKHSFMTLFLFFLFPSISFHFQQNISIENGSLYANDLQLSLCHRRQVTILRIALKSDLHCSRERKKNKKKNSDKRKKKLHNAFAKTLSVSVYCCKNANPSRQSNDEKFKNGEDFISKWEWKECFCILHQDATPKWVSMRFAFNISAGRIQRIPRNRK